MINIGIFNKEDRVLKIIGEELIKEHYKDLNFFFITEDKYLKGDYIVAFKEDAPFVKEGQGIFLSESIGDKDDIFFYQGKEVIKEEILRRIGRDVNIKEQLKLIGVENLIKPYNSTIFSYYLAEYLSSFKAKVCWLSLNCYFPFEYFFPMEGSGLTKAKYYWQNKEELNNRLVKSHGDFYYLENDLYPEDLENTSLEFYLALKDFLKDLNFDYLVLDNYPIFLKPELDYQLVLKTAANGLEERIWQERRSDPGKSILVEGGDISYGSFYSLKKNRLSFNYQNEEHLLWKGILKTQF